MDISALKKQTFYHDHINEIQFLTLEEYQDKIESDINKLIFLFHLSEIQSLQIYKKCEYELIDSIKYIIENDLNKGIELKTINKIESEEILSCKICGEELNIKEFIFNSCSHSFCFSCYKEYIKIQLNNFGSNSIFMTCPEENCKTLLERKFVNALLQDDKENLNRYNNYFNLFKKNNMPNNTGVCPFPGCNIVFIKPKKLSQITINIICPKVHAFCGDCLSQIHTPFTCEQFHILQSIPKKEDKNDFTWIISHTKRCPQCKWNIQKNEGCNHMTCQRCQHQFCWICFGNWATHNGCKKNEITDIKQDKKINENINQIIKMLDKKDTIIPQKPQKPIKRKVNKIQENDEELNNHIIKLEIMNLELKEILVFPKKIVEYINDEKLKKKTEIQLTTLENEWKGTSEIWMFNLKKNFNIKFQNILKKLKSIIPLIHSKLKNLILLIYLGETKLTFNKIFDYYGRSD